MPSTFQLALDVTRLFTLRRRSGQWAGNLPDGKLKEEAAGDLASYLSSFGQDSDLDSAVEWALLVSNEGIELQGWDYMAQENKKRISHPRQDLIFGIFSSWADWAIPQDEQQREIAWQKLEEIREYVHEDTYEEIVKELQPEEESP